ncbi:MAG: hypothetical protein H8E66_14990 [Planctomycetes bacterium]|nr:hypothetical protein [Planctomycetota bacterium]
MRFSWEVIPAILLAATAACSKPDDAVSSGSSVGTADQSDGSQSLAQVSFVGGYELDPRDHGRPVVLIGSALGVTEEVFRDAFSGVTPSRDGPPSRSEAHANKEVLLDALGKHGVTNERFDEVSNYYRYRREAGEVWKRTAVSATAIIKGGKVTGFNITNPGSGYTMAPMVQVAGYDDLELDVTIGFSTDFAENGSVASITVLE